MQYNPARVLSLINKRFGATIGGPGARMELGPITPVTDLDALALLPRANTVTVAVTENGYIDFHTVPPGERWHMEWLRVVSVGADYTYRPAWSRKTLGTSGTVLRFPLQEAVIADGTDFILNSTGIVLNAQDSVSAQVASFVAGDDLSVVVMYWLEECET